MSMPAVFVCLFRRKPHFDVLIRSEYEMRNLTAFFSIVHFYLFFFYIFCTFSGRTDNCKGRCQSKAPINTKLFGQVVFTLAHSSVKFNQCVTGGAIWNSFCPTPNCCLLIFLPNLFALLAFPHNFDKTICCVSLAMPKTRRRDQISTPGHAFIWHFIDLLHVIYG